MTNEIQDSIKDQIKQRLLDPLIGIIILSTISYNWKLISILLFDQKPIIERINYIESVFFSKPEDYLFHFGFPLLFSTIWFLLYPYLRHFTSIYYTWSFLRTEKTKRDITNRINNMSRLDFLEEIYQKLQSIEQPLIRFYQLNKGDQNTYIIIKCNSAEIGDWISNSENIGKLAFQNKDKTIWATGIVVEKFLNGYVLVQTSGELPWAIAGISIGKTPSGPLDYFLSSYPGKMTLEKANSNRESQLVGSSFINSENVFFKINLRVSREAIK
ncbi:hypothetical protein EHR01_10525 [Leptospira mtsangambouensis]|uniref:Uncharacterized protein n=1 Tax=Leptospira mtsangambouensis TaxID=2484912 RepID=A0ABY2NYY7_9LEPT|nr:hypothetical protein [Leptospira mtsangambouensis]TGM74411.1 hypothetical protein EHR01_10525 [Leptospira mtsangambouensis]